MRPLKMLPLKKLGKLFTFTICVTASLFFLGFMSIVEDEKDDANRNYGQGKIYIMPAEQSFLPIQDEVRGRATEARESPRSQAPSHGEKSIQDRFRMAPVKLPGDQNWIAFGIYDKRRGNMGEPGRVRLFVVLERMFKAYKYTCHFADGTVSPAELYTMAENHNKPLGTFALNCAAPKTGEIPLELTLGSDQFSPIKVPITMVATEVEEAEAAAKMNLTICVPVLFGGDANQAGQIVEFMELNRILGVNHVVIYGQPERLLNSTRLVVQYYEKQGFLTFVNFALDLDPLWYHGQLVAINHCHYANIGLSKLVAFNDLDEYMIPMKGGRLVDFLNAAFKERVGSQRISSRFVSTESRAAPLTLQNSVALREDSLLLSKCVIRPGVVFEQGIHHTSRLIREDWTALTANPSELIVAHYSQKAHRAYQPSPFTLVDQFYGQELRRSLATANAALLH